MRGATDPPYRLAPIGALLSSRGKQSLHSHRPSGCARRCTATRTLVASCACNILYPHAGRALMALARAHERIMRLLEPGQWEARAGELLMLERRSPGNSVPAQMWDRAVPPGASSETGTSARHLSLLWRNARPVALPASGRSCSLSASCQSLASSGIFDRLHDYVESTWT